MTHLDQMIADALAQSPDTVIHQLASEVVRMRGEVTDLKRGGVVVPEYPENSFDVRMAVQKAGGMADFDQGVFRAGWEFLASRLRTIPADRELGGVVVPEITPEDIDVGWNVHVDKNPFLGLADGDNDMDWIVETFAAGARHAEALLASRLRTIPADRELGEGAVKCDEIELLRLLRDRAADTAPAGELRMIARDALRAQPAEEPTP